MEKKYMEIQTVMEIEHNTKLLLYYMTKLTERLKQGETPVLWAGEIVKYAANLQTFYSRADDLDIWEKLNFVEIFKNALEQAEHENENDKQKELKL